MRIELLTTRQMAEADRRAVAGRAAAPASPAPSFALMEQAGRAVADVAALMCGPRGRIVVLCGPGNNGGDGFVAAADLARRGFEVEVALLGARAALRGDAATAAALWTATLHAAPSRLQSADLVIDALFGAGLSRALEGDAAACVAAINAAGRPVLSIDVPSGVDAETGAVRGTAVRATQTIAFFRARPGHLLLPGRSHCGALSVVDIGIPDAVLEDLGVSTFRNDPALWQPVWPRLADDGHKFTRGHAIVVSGLPEMTGAARLGARAALRAGAGLVTVASPKAAFPVNAAHLTAVMVQPFEVPKGLRQVLADPRRNAVLIGPGAGVGAATRHMVEIALQTQAAIVLDADALTAFAPAKVEPHAPPDNDAARRDQPVPAPAHLFACIAARSGAPVVLTPHAGEFKRLFGGLAGSKLEQARAAAARSGAIVVLKGADTVIAHPDGRAAINDNAPPTLATAGSGDVLAGFVTGLLAQGMPAFEAACAAVWLHGATAAAFGPGLIAEDLPDTLPRVLADLAAMQPMRRDRT
jgi:NAD(P)H-hydrate epimerase